MHNPKHEVKMDGVDWARITHEKRNAYKVLVGNPECKIPLGRRKLRWDDNIKLVLWTRFILLGIGLL
jgi:hypothetical protein